jgi:hypothetical protein
MRARGAAAVLAAALALCSSAAATAGEPAGRVKPGETVRLGNETPDGKVSGWVCSNDYFGNTERVDLGIKVLEINGRPDYQKLDQLREKVRKDGNLFTLWARRVEDEKKRSRPVAADSAAFACFRPLDLVEAEWADSGPDAHAVTIKLVRSAPVNGTITGKFTRRISWWVFVEVAKGPPEVEHLIGQEIWLQGPYVSNPDRKSPDSILPAPHIAKVLADVSVGGYLDVNYKIDTALRLVSVTKSSAPPPAKPPAAAPKPEAKPAPPDKPAPPPDKPPKPAPPPGPKPGGDDDF